MESREAADQRIVVMIRSRGRSNPIFAGKLLAEKVLYRLTRSQ